MEPWYQPSSRTLTQLASKLNVQFSIRRDGKVLALRGLLSELGTMQAGPDASEEPVGSLSLGRRHEDDDLALVADRERVHGVRETRGEKRRDALALEEALHHDRLGPIAAADLGEAAVRAGLARQRRKPDHLPAAGHRSEYNPFSPHPAGGRDQWESSSTSAGFLRSGSFPGRPPRVPSSATSTSRSTGGAASRARAPIPTISNRRTTGG